MKSNIYGCDYMYGVSLDKSKIEELLKDFYTLTRVRIAFISYDGQEYISAQRGICDFCRILRSDSRADRKCRECDHIAFNKALNTGELYIYQCHAGLTEAVSPIMVEGKLLGYLMLGQTMKTPSEGREWESVLLKCREYKVDFKKLKEAFYKLEYLSQEKIEATARIMDMSAKYIHFARIADLKSPPLIKKIKSYVDSRIEQPITIADLSKILGMSKSYLSHVIKKELGMSLTQYIQNQRILMAKNMLKKSNKKVGEIAELVGFEDANYFARVFKKITGISPSEYRIKDI